MINKKAGINFLGEKTTDIVVAVLVIIMLVFLGAKIFGMFSDKSELTKAIDNVNAFAGEYNAFILLKEPNHKFIILGPKDWFIASYPNEGEVVKSAGCGDYENCVCICKYDCNDELTACANISVQFKIGKDLGYEMDEIPYQLILQRNDPTGTINNDKNKVAKNA